MSHRIICSAIGHFDFMKCSDDKKDFVHLALPLTCIASIWKAVTPNYFSSAQISGCDLLNLVVENLPTLEFVITLHLGVGSGKHGTPTSRETASIQKAVKATALHIKKIRFFVSGDDWLTPEISALLLDPKATPYLERFWILDTKMDYGTPEPIPSPKQFRLIRDMITSPSLLKTRTGLVRVRWLLSEIEAILAFQNMPEMFAVAAGAMTIEALQKSVPPLKEQAVDPSKLSSKRNFTNGIKNLFDYIVELVRVIEMVLEPQTNVKLPVIEKNAVLGHCIRIFCSLNKSSNPSLSRLVQWSELENIVFPLMERVMSFCCTDFLAFSLEDDESLSVFSINLHGIPHHVNTLVNEKEGMKRKEKLLSNQNSALSRLVHHFVKAMKLLASPANARVAALNEKSNSIGEHAPLLANLQALVSLLDQEDLNDAVAKSKTVLSHLLFHPRDFACCLDPQFASNTVVFEKAMRLMDFFNNVYPPRSILEFYCSESQPSALYRNLCTLLKKLYPAKKKKTVCSVSY